MQQWNDLAAHAHMERIKVSEAIDSLRKYIEQHESDDYLLVGFHSQKANPFKDRPNCILL